MQPDGYGIACPGRLAAEPPHEAIAKAKVALADHSSDQNPPLGVAACGGATGRR